jgi:hypothetical protein
MAVEKSEEEGGSIGVEVGNEWEKGNVRQGGEWKRGGAFEGA